MSTLRHEPGRVHELEAEAGQIVEAAKASGPPNLIVQAYVAQSTLLIGLRRLEEADAAAKSGEAVLFGGKPEAEALHAGIDREFFLQLRWARLHAAALGLRFQEVLALGRPVIRAIEEARSSIGNPTQQGTFLARRTFAFECVALAAFKLGDWDTVLEVTDLLKARATIRNRLSPPASEDVAQLQRELLSVSGALALAASPERRALLRRQRNELWELVAVSRWRRASESLPSLALAEVQRALDIDEAAVSWTWVGQDVLLVVAIDRDRIHAEAVVLSDEQGEIRRLCIGGPRWHTIQPDAGRSDRRDRSLRVSAGDEGFHQNAIAPEAVTPSRSAPRSFSRDPLRWRVPYRACGRGLRT